MRPASCSLAPSLRAASCEGPSCSAPGPVSALHRWHHRGGRKTGLGVREARGQPSHLSELAQPVLPDFGCLLATGKWTVDPFRAGPPGPGSELSSGLLMSAVPASPLRQHLPYTCPCAPRSRDQGLSVPAPAVLRSKCRHSAGLLILVAARLSPTEQGHPGMPAQAWEQGRVKILYTLALRSSQPLLGGSRLLRGADTEVSGPSFPPSLLLWCCSPLSFGPKRGRDHSPDLRLSRGYGGKTASSFAFPDFFF